MGYKKHPIRQLVTELGLKREERDELPRTTRHFLFDTMNLSDEAVARLAPRRIRSLALEFLRRFGGSRFWPAHRQGRRVWPRDSRFLTTRICEIMARQMQNKLDALRKTKSVVVSIDLGTDSSDDETVEREVSDDTFIPAQPSSAQAERYRRLGSGSLELLEDLDGDTIEVNSDEAPRPEKSTFKSLRGSLRLPERISGHHQAALSLTPPSSVISVLDEDQLLPLVTQQLVSTKPTRRKQQSLGGVPPRQETEHALLQVSDAHAGIVRGKRFPSLTNNDVGDHDSEEVLDLCEFNGRLYDASQLSELPRIFLQYVRSCQNNLLRMAHSRDVPLDQRRDYGNEAVRMRIVVSDMETISKSYAIDATDDERLLASQAQEKYKR